MAESRGNAPDHRDLEKRRHFFAAAEPLFTRYGFRKTTVEDVCRAAGASKRTFYELFRDKGDFFARMILAAAAQAIDGWRQQRPEDASAEVWFDSYMEGYARFAQECPAHVQSMTEPELRHGFEGLEQEVFHPLIEPLREIIEHGMKRGEFRRVDPERLAWIVGLLLDCMHYVIPQQYGLPGAADDPATARELREFILHGLRL
jgi:AcrR family transcriptional regulator